jgi:high-affinity iron transporter
LLFGLSFLAVYREVFETVLFYQALWLQVGDTGRGAMIAGIATAIGFLLLALWAILRAGATLPIRQFFTFCAYTVLVLAVIFTGKGVVALQESGVIAQTTVNHLPTVSVLGVYPSVQGIGAQVLVLLFAFTWLRRQRRASAP